MTIPKALPPGSSHHTEVQRIADQMQNTTDALTKTQTAPRPAGMKTSVTAELPMKSRRTTRATV